MYVQFSVKRYKLKLREYSGEILDGGRFALGVAAMFRGWRADQRTDRAQQLCRRRRGARLCLFAAASAAAGAFTFSHAAGIEH